ncbi:hypothetical protein B0H66DRAFT_88702 [Apodospora peruviana]|uniref:DNA polymerase n=1 Tax=Apodospora peruviana TaxID=516989 RepID=A0AAE0MHF0_9PEZI|nr:hypothetical protein B0H66DRAFT_88702 [Apodospora peruviana]
MDNFRVRLNCIDHYQATPTRYDPPLHIGFRASQASKEPKVPVVRVFGSTETGQKVCAHIHGAFPYLYIDYGGAGLGKAEVAEYIRQFHRSIDRALALSYRRDINRDHPRFVARITLVKGIPFYGFHVGYRFYLKIYMLNPVVMTRLADLLQQGVIMSRKFQPYEAHLQYLLQFMTDYNLYGCGYIDAGTTCFRAPVPDHDDEDDTGRTWNNKSIPRASITDDFSLPRVSHCSLEVDICVQDILNRKDVKERPLHHDFIEKEQPLPSDLKLVHSMAGLWVDETKRRRRMRNLSPGSSPFPPEVLVSLSADSRHTQPASWMHEEENRRKIQLLLDEEKSTMNDTEVSFSTFVRPIPLQGNVKTTLQSVEDLFPENLLPALGLEEQLLAASAVPDESIDVDEKAFLDLRTDKDAQENFPDGLNEDLILEAQKAEETAEEQSDKNGISDDERYQTNNGDAVLDEALRPVQMGGLEEHSKLDVNKRPIKTINDLGGGFTASGFRSGKRPLVALCRGLVDAADAEGHFGNEDEFVELEVGVEPCLKRARSDTADITPPKRVKLEVPNATYDTKLNKSMIADDQSVSTVKSKLDRPKHELASLSQSSRSLKPMARSSSMKQSGKQTLNFAVVKDARNPNTKLRLGQQAGSQSSQSKKDRIIRKHVSFDPCLHIQEPAPSAHHTPKEPLHQTPSTDSKPTCSPPPPKLIWSGSTRMFVVNSPPPSLTEIRSTMQSYNLPEVIYQDAFYGEDTDVPPRPREYAGKEFRLDGNSLPYLPAFDATGGSPAAYGIKPEVGPDFSQMELAYERQQKLCTLKSWELAEPPPSFDEVSDWWAQKQKQRGPQKPGTTRPLPATQNIPGDLSQITGATPKNRHGFKYPQKRKSTSVQHEAQYMSTMSLEVHVNTRAKLVPNPEEDEVQCIFWCFGSDENTLRGSQNLDSSRSGIVVLSEDGSLAEKFRSQTGAEVAEEASELDLMVRMVEIVRAFDPDILAGYEVHGSSWGYLIERASSKYDWDLCDEFSRMKSQSHGRIGKDTDRWGFNTTSTIRVTGRHMINIWRAMRGELNLLQYSMENVVWHLLHRRIPHYSWRTLTDWYRSGRPRDLSNVLRYYLTRTRLDIQILEANELVPRTSEQARLLGVDFFSVFSRGSQFKVESIMFRIAKPENFLLVSPSRKQVGGQNALECLPLVMEPQSAFYSSPLLVLDFQSLYPSVMIAYNYCYSTFLGRIVDWRGTNKMGFTEYKRREGLLQLLKDYINIAPNGVMYTKPEIRKSLLAKMLTEILETRVMVKSGMKQDKDDKTLQQLLNNRQLALKLLANVTYGYTSASFSGRMPCSEIADSIVQTGRETLERAIAYIHSVKRWGAEVVYGDTDSLFVYLKGRTREQAFDIGAEMAEAITHMNPRPIKLKFEKVYHPCLLLTKKRYVGYKYESRDQIVPEFDAKGIETVRRDGTVAEQKIEEKALKILFETADLSQVKAYFQAQCSKIMRSAVSVQDFCFAREVKLGTYSTKGPLPPGAMISAKRMQEDTRAEPQYGERVPYVVVAGAPGAKLVDRCVAPEDLLNNPHGTLDAEYYIGKNIIPPLERIFNLVGANVRAWYDEMPKVQLIRQVDNPSLAPAAPAPASTAAAAAAGPFGMIGAGAAGGGGGQQKTMESFMRSASCVVCGVKMKRPAAGSSDVGEIMPVCRKCVADAGRSMVQLQTRMNREERRLADVTKLCQTCSGLAPMDEVKCDNKDCPVFYTRVKKAARSSADRGLVGPLVKKLGELSVAEYERSRQQQGEGLDW